MKKFIKVLSLILIVVMSFSGVGVYANNIVFVEELEVEAEEKFSEEWRDEGDSTDELMPLAANSSGDIYANRHFDTLQDAKKYYGMSWEYKACDIDIEPGCYGGYWSDGGHYSYYYTMDDGSRIYIHVGD